MDDSNLSEDYVCGTHTAWSDIIARNIERNLIRFKEGKLHDITFVRDMGGEDPALEDPKSLKGHELLMVWHFADSFFDAVTEGLPDVDNIPIEESVILLEDVLYRLKHHLPIADRRITRYKSL